MFNKLKIALKKIKVLEKPIDIFKNLYHNPQIISLLIAFDQYSPNSNGNPSLRTKLTKKTINEIFNSINLLSSQVSKKNIQIIDIESINLSDEEKNAVETLEKLFNKYGSDKANNHNYHILYGQLLSKNFDIENILEVGIGTNNEDTVSHMSFKGKPGASLRAFSEFCPKANIIGADYDQRILFQENKIKTFHVDQTSNESLDKLEKNLIGKFDLIIDDGLHSPDANINTLRFASKLIKKGGTIVIEDINPKAIAIWTSIGYLLPEKEYSCQLIKSQNDLLFLVTKL